MQQTHRPAFTLIEVLVVIAVIAILAAILFPVFAQAREQARQAKCMSNMRQFAAAGYMYCQDYDEMWVPPFKGPAHDCTLFYWWDDLLQPYMRNRELPLCPSWQGTVDCAAPENLTLNGKLKPYSYGINTVEEWDLTAPWKNDVADHHGFRCQGPRRQIDEGCSVAMAEMQDPAGTIWITDATNLELFREASFDYAPPLKGGLSTCDPSAAGWRPARLQPAPRRLQYRPWRRPREILPRRFYPTLDVDHRSRRAALALKGAPHRNSTLENVAWFVVPRSADASATPM